MTNFGLYVHAPFCRKKCNYCDFYSLSAQEKDIDPYVARVKEEINRWGVRIAHPIDTLYFGGGTPSLLGGENIGSIISAADNAFSIKENAEITLECNPADELTGLFYKVRERGVNRLSIGVQSGRDDELCVLGRRHTVRDAEKTVRAARSAGFSNISLDLMIGLPDSTIETLRDSLNFILSQNPEHISVYMLKIEKGTPFYREKLNLPDDEATAAQYLFVCEELSKHGYGQYEISNFCREGFHSRHNKNYWLGGEYLGIGPSAHSFLCGRRFYYPRSLSSFMEGVTTVPDGRGGDLSEFIMLRLRLAEGLLWTDAKALGADIENMKRKAARLQKCGLLVADDKGMKLTREGFLLSNAVIGEFI